MVSAVAVFAPFFSCESKVAFALLTCFDACMRVFVCVRVYVREKRREEGGAKAGSKYIGREREGGGSRAATQPMRISLLEGREAGRKPQ